MNSILPSTHFWQGKKVFLTGHTGFKGSWVSLWLQSLSAQVMGYALQPPTTPNLYNLAQIETGMKSVTGDVRDLASLSDALACFRPEIVIHMAAQPLVRQSYLAPVETYATNVMGTVNLLEAVRYVDSVKSVIIVTSDKCYENNESQRGYAEQDALGGHDPYSNSKACAELVTDAYRRSFFQGDESHRLGIATVRSGNVIGGGDFATDRLVPDILRACLHNDELSLRYPGAIRPWQHVLEPLRGYLLLAEKLYQAPAEYSGVWNFGPNINDAKTVRWIADYLCRTWGRDIKVSSADTPLVETHQLLLSSAKAGEKLQWQPWWNVEKTLKVTAEWHLAHTQQQDMRDYTLGNITSYIAQN